MAIMDEVRDALAETQYSARLTGGMAETFGGALRRLGLDLAVHPATAVRTGADLALQQGTVALHTLSRLFGADPTPVCSPPPGDRRFADRAWSDNPFLRGILESYLVSSQWWRDRVAESHLDPEERQRARFAVARLIDALAPSNLPFLNPAVVKEAIDTGGLSTLRGLRTMVEDVVRHQGRPQQVDASAFQLGRDLAATPGRVVMRNRLIELIAYQPQTERVHEVPILCSPPWINKYYIMDLAPGRSWVEHMVKNGFTVFMISYRNPDASLAELTMDDYMVEGVLAAMDRVQAITGAPRVDIAGLCLGGTYAILAAAHLAARGEADRLGWVTVTNTLVDFSEPGELGLFCDPEMVRRLEEAMSRRGFLEASRMAGTFDWLRDNDLIWNYVVSNWYMGKKPPAFDILAWNSDSTNMPAVMHTQYLRACYLENRLVRPGAFTIAGTPVDLSRVRTPFFVLGAEADHITPWRGTYRTTRLLGGEVHYVLTNSGHIAGVVNPPGSPKSRHWTNPRTPSDPERWRAGATAHQGSWWAEWVRWVSERSGPMVHPPELPDGEPAPGRYVRNRTGPPFDAIVELRGSAAANGVTRRRRPAPEQRGAEPSGREGGRGAEERTASPAASGGGRSGTAQQEGALAALGEPQDPRADEPSTSSPSSEREGDASSS
jgi:poly[(R)-3-hydroxyalkanoate] polymerase subunit PhaC